MKARSAEYHMYRKTTYDLFGRMETKLFLFKRSVSFGKDGGVYWMLIYTFYDDEDVEREKPMLEVLTKIAT